MKSLLLLTFVIISLSGRAAHCSSLQGWTPGEVGSWAKTSLGISDHYVSMINTMELDGEVMLNMARGDLVNLGFSVGVADKLVRGVSALASRGSGGSGGFLPGTPKETTHLATEDAQVLLTLPLTASTTFVYLVNPPVSTTRGTLATSLGSTVALGSVVRDDPHHLLYTPPSNYYGEDSFWVTFMDPEEYASQCPSGAAVVTDDGEPLPWLGENCAGVHRIRINVVPVNDAPQAVGDTATVSSGSSVLIPVVLNDRDVDRTSPLGGPSEWVAPCLTARRPPPSGTRPATVVFEDVAARLGLSAKQSRSRTSPHCLFDQYDASINRWDKGSFCTPELTTGGASVGDYDGDGLLDIFYAVLDSHDVLWRNNGDGTFQDVTQRAGLGDSFHASNFGEWFDVDNDGDMDIFVSTLSDTRFYLYINNGAGQFTEEAIPRGLAYLKKGNVTAGFSIAAADYDNDGWTDVYTTEWLPRFEVDNDFVENPDAFVTCRLMRNMGGSGHPGVFEDATQGAGIRAKRLRSESKSRHSIISDELRRSGATEEEIDAAITAMIEQDAANQAKKRKALRDARVFEAKGGKLPEASFLPFEFDGIFQFSTQFTDLDEDGHLDLMITGDFGTNLLYWNNGNGTFSRGMFALNEHEDHSMGSTVADVDLDGHQDIFLSSVWVSDYDLAVISKFFPGAGLLLNFRGNRLYRGAGDRRFVDFTKEAGVLDAGWSWGAVFFDYDNDGDADLYAINGFDDPETTEDDFAANQANVFWENQVNRRSRTERGADPLPSPLFASVAPARGLASRLDGRAVFDFDYDSDGDLDLFVVNHGEAPSLLRNEGGHFKDWVRVDALAYGHQATGTKVYLAVQPADVDAEVMQEVRSKAGFLSQGEQVAHFGLGVGLKTVHRIRVVFLVTGNEHVFYDVPTRATLVVTDNTAVSHQTFEYVAADSNLPACTRLTISAVASPFHGIAKVSPSKRAVEYFADPGYTGDDSFVYTITDGTYTSTTTVNITVVDVENEHTDDASQWTQTHATFDGRFNNKDHPLWGKAFTGLRRLSPSVYADGVDEPAGKGRPSTRLISNVLFPQRGDIFDERGIAEFNTHFGQFFTHDMDFVTPLADYNQGGNFVIEIPKGDPWFDSFSTGKETMRFRRSAHTPTTGGNTGLPREQINKVTAWLDLNTIYGTSPNRARLLRSGVGGKLTVSEGNHLKFNTDHAPNLNLLGAKRESLVLSGDNRANVQPGLIAMHTIFHREHNYWAEQVAAKDPTLSDDVIFERARSLTRSAYQAMCWNEFIPSLLGSNYPLPPYTGYKPEVDPTVSNEFATAIFRFGHSQVSDKMRRLKEDYTTESSVGILELRDAYFRPNQLVGDTLLDDLVRGMLVHKAQRIDTKAVDGVRNHLFGTNTAGFDLMALNIQRGRDHALADYNTVRAAVGLARVKTFSEISSDPEVVAALESLYKSVDDIDLFVGFLAEDHLPDASLGELGVVIIREQITRLRDSDRFWFQNRDGLSWVEDDNEWRDLVERLNATTMKDILHRNTGVKVPQSSKSVFFVPTA